MATGQIKTRRWDDPIESDDGVRILICRYRPRGLPKSQETWTEWLPDLAPSVQVHAAAYGKGVLKIPWQTYRVRYLTEMLKQKPAIAALAGRVREGQTITLLCSSSCERESRCHRSLLEELIRAEMTRMDEAPG
jgi:uncharacterized protein YeaO (DUF488 family)